MRLFVAVDLSAEIAAAAGDVIARLRARVHETAPGAKVTWSVPERLHVTVRFIGQIADERVETICRALRPHLAVPPFEIELSGVGAFPGKGSPRVIWAGITAGSEGLKLLEHHVSDRLASAGIERDSRPYSPHLTLGRVRNGAGLRTAALLDAGGSVPLGSVVIDAITLYESRLSPKGAQYLALQRTELSGLESGQPSDVDHTP